MVGAAGIAIGGAGIMMARSMDGKAQQAVFNWGFWAVLGAAFLWGTTGTAASFAPHLSPLAVGAVAMGGGGLLQALLARRAIAASGQTLRQHKAWLLLGALAVAVYPLAFYSSMRLAGITVGTVVSIGTAPLFSALLERCFDHKPLSLRWGIGFALGVGGVALLSLGEGHGTPEAGGGQETWGIVLGALAGLTYALYSWIARKLMENGIAAKAAMGSILGCGAVLLLPTLLWSGGNLLAENAHVWVLAYMTLVPMFLGYVLFGYGLKHIAASRAITLTLFEPVVAAILAIVLVGERVSAAGWLGMVLIFACLLCLSRSD